MIDLHVHLDGSMRPQTIIELAMDQDVALPNYNVNKLKNMLNQSANTQDMEAYLKRFDLSLSVLQTKKAIRRAVSELVRDLDSQGIIYTEIRLMPQAHVMQGLSQRQVVEAALEGMNHGMEFSSEIKASLVLCTMRGADEKDNFETIVSAADHLGKGVCGVDMLGDEYTYRNDMYAGQFRLLREEHIPFAVHAGVMVGAESIRQAIEYGAKRVGHGLRANEDPTLLWVLKENDIVIEMCPTSNIQSHAVRGIRQHPIRQYYDRGVKVTVGTDNMTISNTNLRKEYSLLKEFLGFTQKDIYKMNEYAVDGAFMSKYEKRLLRERLREKIANESTVGTSR